MYWSRFINCLIQWIISSCGFVKFLLLPLTNFLRALSKHVFSTYAVMSFGRSHYGYHHTSEFIIFLSMYMHRYWFINPKLDLKLMICFEYLYCILNTSLQIKLQYGLHWVVYHHPLCTQKKIYIGSYNTACSTCTASKVLNPLDWRLNKSSFP